MCLICYKPSKVSFSRDMLERAAEQNSDGWGFAALTVNDVYVEKGLDFKKDSLRFPCWEGKSPIDVMMEMVDYEMVVHFRKNSSGDTSIQNVHPIHTGYGDTWLAHNGTMNGLSQKDDPISDTAHFGQWIGLFLSMSKGRFQKDLNWWKRLEFLAGSSNKIAIVRPSREGGITILNRSTGYELKDGIWVSNKNWEYSSSGSGYAGYMGGGLHERVVCANCGYCGHGSCKSDTKIKCPKDYHFARECNLSTYHGNTPNCWGLRRTFTWPIEGVEVEVCGKCYSILKGDVTGAPRFKMKLLPEAAMPANHEKTGVRWGIVNLQTDKWTELQGTYMEMDKACERLNDASEANWGKRGKEGKA